MKKALPPLVFFLTIALMVAGFWYRQSAATQNGHAVKVGKMTYHINPEVAKKLAAGSPVLVKPQQGVKEPFPETAAGTPTIAVTPANGEAQELDAFMPIVITGFLGLVALGLLIWRKNDPDAQKWVYSTFGAILGYWLKGST
jgi:hypothetical protein